MEDFKKTPFGYLKATTTTTHLGLSQMLVSKEEEDENRKQMKIKFECFRDDQQQQQQQSHQQQQQQLKNHQKMEMKVFQRKIKRRASSSSTTIDVTVVEEEKMKMNSSIDFSTCPVCFKFFRNKKALFGHMRAHPERQWRGIQPPPPSPLKVMKKKNSSSSSSTVSDSLVMSMDEQIDSASTSGRRLGFDVLRSISNWPGTVKRRRNVAVSDHRVLDAIDGLLMLVHGNSMETDDHGNMYMDLLSKNESLEVIEEEASERSKKRRIEAMNKSEDEVAAMNKWKKVKVYHRNGGDLRSGFVPELMKMECRDQIPVINNNISNGNGFKCGTCNKAFPTYQALGGHKSRNCCRNSTTFQPDYHHQVKNISCPNLIKVDIELKEFNDARPKDVDYKHKCKVCGKTFSTGQALGGHQRSHWNIMNGAATLSVSSMALPQIHNVETPSESVASLEDPGKTSIKLMEFDLNELPPEDYDEECLSQLVPPVFGLTA